MIRDLCARLPYGVIGLYSWKNREPYNRELTDCLFDELKSSWNSTEDSEFLPYLRPMSSMNSEEEQEYSFLLNDCGWGVSENLISYCIDWLNAHHFDYRGLIPKGLALEAPEGMYNNKE